MSEPELFIAFSGFVAGFIVGAAFVLYLLDKERERTRP
jgi:hypothetical protein